VVLFGIGIGFRLATRTPARGMPATNPDVMALAAEPSTPTEAPPNVIATKESKIGPPPPGGRQSLYNSEIQSHLQTMSEVETVSDMEMSISDFYFQSPGYRSIESSGERRWDESPRSPSGR
jgi:hypothetical protein